MTHESTVKTFLFGSEHSSQNLDLPREVSSSSLIVLVSAYLGSELRPKNFVGRRLSESKIRSIQAMKEREYRVQIKLIEAYSSLIELLL